MTVESNCRSSVWFVALIAPVVNGQGYFFGIDFSTFI